MTSASDVPSRLGILDRMGAFCVLSMPVVALTNLLSLTQFAQLNVRPTDLLFLGACILWGLRLAWTMRLDKDLMTYLFTFAGLVFVTFLGILLLDNGVGWPRYLRFLQTMSWGALSFTFIRTQKQFDKFTNVVIFVSAFVGSISIGLYLINPSLHRIAGYFSFAGGEGLEGQASYNEWGALYALSLTILLWRLYQRGLSRVDWVPLAVLVAGLLLVQSRSAFLALAAVITIVGLLYAKRFYLSGLDRASATAILGLAFPIAFAVIASGGLAINRLAESFVSGSGDQISMEARFDVWEASLDLWNAGVLRFLLGYGGQSFANLIDSPTADSFYLDHGLSQGFLGLVFILALVITPAMKLRLDPRTALAALVVTVALTVSLTGNVLADPTYGGVTFALLYGLLSLHDRRHPHLLPARR